MKNLFYSFTFYLNQTNHKEFKATKKNSHILGATEDTKRFSCILEHNEYRNRSDISWYSQSNMEEQLPTDSKNKQ